MTLAGLEREIITAEGQMMESGTRNEEIVAWFKLAIVAIRVLIYLAESITKMDR